MNSKVFEYKSDRKRAKETTNVLETVDKEGIVCSWTGSTTFGGGNTNRGYYWTLNFTWDFDWTKLKEKGVGSLTGHLIVKPSPNSPRHFGMQKVDINLKGAREKITNNLQTQFYQVDAFFEYHLTAHYAEIPEIKKVPYDEMFANAERDAVNARRSNKMTENLKTKPQINELILNAAINKKSVFISFKKLCKIQGNENMDYLDFEWKYYQYYHGNRDLKIERSPNNSSPLTFTELPIDVLEKVVEKSRLVDCLTLRKVSKNLQNLVDSAGIHCEKIEFAFRKTSSTIDFFTKTLTYERADNGCCRVTFNKKSRQETKIYEDKRNYRKAMIADATTFLKNSKLEIGFLMIYNNWNENLFEFLDFLKSLNFQLTVRSFYILTTGTNHLETLETLQLIKPESLQEIELDAFSLTVDEFNVIAETEQWKRAKKLRVEDLPVWARAEKFLHFKEIDINQIYLCPSSLATLTVIRDILLGFTHLEHCCLCYEDIDREEEEEDFEDVLNEIMSQHPAYDLHTRRFSIPNSEEYFQLEVCSSQRHKEVHIERIREDQNSYSSALV